MDTQIDSRIPELLQKHEQELLADWTKEQVDLLKRYPGRLSEGELTREMKEFLDLLKESTQSGNLSNIYRPEWERMRNFLASISRSRAVQGFSPAETAGFVFSLKQLVFTLLQRESAGDPEALAREIWSFNLLLDRLGLYAIEQYQTGREEIIVRQQKELTELSTPVIEIWEGILALPLIGTLDSTRTQTVMENLLQRIVDTGSTIAIIDITGVPTVDTMVAQHLIKTVAAARLMGTECMISGIRPQIAQTIVHLGVSFPVETKATLADALEMAFKRLGLNLQMKR